MTPVLFRRLRDPLITQSKDTVCTGRKKKVIAGFLSFCSRRAAVLEKKLVSVADRHFTVTDDI